MSSPTLHWVRMDPSACEPNPEYQVPLSKVALRYYGAVDPKRVKSVMS